MQRPSTYFSLSGFSGILLGIYGLLTVYIVNMLTGTYGDGIDGSSQLPIALLEIGVIVLIVIMVLISLLTLKRHAKKRAKKQDKKLWNTLSKKLRIHTLVPLLLFIIVVVIIANKGYYSSITPLLLFLYGMFLLNLSRLSTGNLKYLAIAEIILAIVAYFVYDKELLFLSLGFGIFHIIYGTLTFNRKVTVNQSR